MATEVKGWGDHTRRWWAGNILFGVTIGLSISLANSIGPVDDLLEVLGLYGVMVADVLILTYAKYLSEED
jgi:hypothetical protein